MQWRAIAYDACWLATLAPQIVWSDRPQKSAALHNLPTSLIDKGTSMPVSLLTKVVKRLRSRAARFAPKN